MSDLTLLVKDQYELVNIVEIPNQVREIFTRIGRAMSKFLT